MTPQKTGVQVLAYRPQLDLLRAIAFLMVFAVHTFPAGNFLGGAVGWLTALAISTGRFGVDLFFALSAVLITSLLLSERERTGAVDVRAFYARRLLRIAPLLIGFLIVTAILTHTLRLPSLDGLYVLGFVMLIGNWLIAFHGAVPAIYMPLWSLCVEEQFYVIWPPLIRHLSRRRLMMVGGAMIGGSILCRAAFVLGGASPDTIAFLTITRLDALGAGVVLATLPHAILRAGWAIPGFAGLLGAEALRASGPAGWPVVPAFALAGISSAIVVAAAHRWTWRPAMLVQLGRISFGLYIAHGLMNALARMAIPHAEGLLALGRAVLTLAATIIVAQLSYRYYERTFLRLKDRLKTEGPPAAPTLVLPRPAFIASRPVSTPALQDEAA